jgi:hypothetical protein
MHKACFNYRSDQQARDGAPAFLALIENRTEGTLTHGTSTRPRGADCESSARRRSGALLLWAIPSLLVACGGGGGNADSSPGTPPVTLQWDAVIDPSLVGYRLYYGLIPGTYLQAPGEGLSVGNVPTFTLTGLSSGTTYYFGVRAYDSENNESAYSNEISTTAP